MKTSSIAVETSRSTTQGDSIVRQTNKRSSYLSYTTMNIKHIFNDIGFTSVSLFLADLRLCTQRSARPLLAGWYGVDVMCLIPFLLKNSWNSSDLNYGALSLTN